MRVGCLQFSPQSDQADGVNFNMTRADSVLTRPKARRGMSIAADSRLDILVLPQMAFSGANFGSEKDIQPFLEPAVAGETQLWARTAAIKYQCNVVVGYPQRVDIACAESTNVEYFSSSIMVDFHGKTLANNDGRTRDGREPTFSDCIVKRRGKLVDKTVGKVSIGQYICPSENEVSNFGELEAFAYHILEKDISIAIIPMAWRTKQPRAEFFSRPLEPDVDSLSHWLRGLWSLVDANLEKEIIVILCNQTGNDGNATYAGTSAVLGIKSGEVLLYGLLGGGKKDLLVVDTTKSPIGKLVFVEEEDNKLFDDTESSEAEPLTPDASYEQSGPAQEYLTKYTVVKEKVPYEQNALLKKGTHPFDAPPEPVVAGLKMRPNVSTAASLSKPLREMNAAESSACTGSTLPSSAFTSTARSPTASTPHPNKSHGDWRNHHARKRRTSRSHQPAAPPTPTTSSEDPITAISASSQCWNMPQMPFTPDTGSPFSTGKSSVAGTTVSVFNGPAERGPKEPDRPASPKSRNAEVVSDLEFHGGPADCEVIAALACPSIMTTNLQTGRISRERRGRSREQRLPPEKDGQSSSRDSTRNGMLHRRVNRSNAGNVHQVCGGRSQSAGSQRPRAVYKAVQESTARRFGFHSWLASKEELQRASVEIHERLLKLGADVRNAS